MIVARWGSKRGAMESFWRAAGVQLGKYWWVVLGVILVVSAVMVPGLGRLEFATGQDSYLNSDSQVAQDNEFFQDRFGGEVVVLLYRPTDGGDITGLIDGANGEELQRIESEIRAIPGDLVFATITPWTSVQFSDNVIQENVGTNALLSAALRDEDGGAVRQEDIQLTLARLEAFPVEDRTVENPEWVDFLLYGNDGFALGDDGAVVEPPVDQRLIRPSLRSSFPGEPGEHVAVGGIVLKGNASLQEQTDATDAVLEIMETAELDGFEVVTTGSPVYLKEINDYLQGGMLTLGATAVVVMAFVLLFLFRVRWRLLPLVVVLIGVMWAFGLLGYLGIELSLVTISGLPILIGVGIDFAIQIHNRVEEEVVLDKEQHPIAESLSNVAPALVVATVGGVLAFAALRVSQVPMIRSFGVMLIVGIVVLLITGITFPASWLGIREWRGRTQERGESRVERLVVWLGSLPSSAGLFLVLASVALFVGGIALEGQFKIESDPIRWIDQDSEAVEDVDTLTEETGFETTLGILVQANNVFDQDVIDVMHEFTLDAENRERTDTDSGPIVTASSLTNTMAKIIQVPGATDIAPTTEDLVAASSPDVLPPDIARALFVEDLTAAQINFRLAPASLDVRAELIEDLEADLARRLEEVDLPPDSILLVEIDEGDDPIRVVPSGLATVGVGLLENLKANRTILTYLGLALVGLWLLIRFRSITRALLSLVPVGLAIGASSVIIAVLGLDLSPLTTVSGPLVIATCTEFSVLILSRFLEERRQFDARTASDHAAARTGRAFFTSAATTIGGFAVLVISPLPLLRDFGLIVTLNVGIALLSALVVMPPLMVWADNRGLLSSAPGGGSIRLAADYEPRRFALTGVGIVVAFAAAVGLFLAADSEDGQVSAQEFTAVELPPPTTTAPPTTTTAEPGAEEPEPIDLSQFPEEAPTEGLLATTAYGLLTAQGATGQQANCTVAQLAPIETEILALGADALTDPRVAAAALECTISQEIVDATIAAGITG